MSDQCVGTASCARIGERIGRSSHYRVCDVTSGTWTGEGRVSHRAVLQRDLWAVFLVLLVIGVWASGCASHHLMGVDPGPYVMVRAGKEAEEKTSGGTSIRPRG